MNILRQVVGFFKVNDDEGYIEILNDMKIRLEKLNIDYNDLLQYKVDIISDRDKFCNAKFIKKEKYIDEMENIKFKDSSLIKEYNLVALKYNILIELYLKINQYISNCNNPINIEFGYDDFKQTVAIIWHKEGDDNKMILLSNVLDFENYIIYKNSENYYANKSIGSNSKNHLEILESKLKKLTNDSNQCDI